MAFGVRETEATGRHRDLDRLIDYREYEGSWSWSFEEHRLRPRLRDLGYRHVRFFGGKTCEHDGSFRERICELKRPGCAVEYNVYG